MAGLNIRLEPPAPFPFKTPDQWQRWKKRFNQYRLASGLSTEGDERQISTLLYCMGEDAEETLNSTDITEANRKVYNTVVLKFDEFFKIRKNVIFERARFNLRAQGERESIEQFITSLYSLAESCEFGALKDELIRDRIVVGIRDKALSQRMQVDPNLTLEKAKREVRQREAVQEQQGVLDGDRVTTVDSVRYHRPSWRSTSKSGNCNKSLPTGGTSKPKPNPSNRCQRCGKAPHSKLSCPASQAVCHSCKKKGHFSSVCLSKGISSVVTTEHTGTDEYYLNTVTSNNAGTWNCAVLVNDRVEVLFKIDTGAEVTVVTETVSDRMGGSLKPTQKILYGPDRKPLSVVGELSIPLEYHGKRSIQSVFVVKGLQENLLGLPAIQNLGILTISHSLHTVTQSIVDQYPSLFTGLGTFDEGYSIKLRPNSNPFSLFVPRNVPLPLRKKVRDELCRMEELGVITKVTTPTNWCAGMVVVPKKSGDVRICVDFRPLNESVVRETHPLPTVEETLAQLAGALVFSKLDANSGFWQIPLDEQSRPFTTFITPFGRFWFNKLPFGISSAPECFQRRMSNILEGEEGVLCHMDDILIFGRTKEEHDVRLHRVMKKVLAAGITLNKDKCEFNRETLHFLGHKIDQAGISADPNKTEAIVRMEKPKTRTELRRFLGMANQLGKFSPHLADLSKPLRELLSTRAAWVWDQSQDIAFQQVKEELTKPVVLALYDPSAEMKVCTDASAYGLGAVLMQKYGSQWKAVAYASRSLSPTESRYSQIEKEALGLVWACEKFSNYIIGAHIQLETDHKPLIPLLGKANLDSLRHVQYETV